MASYAVVRSNLIAQGGVSGSEDVLAVVVTDGQRTIVLPEDDECGLSDVDWPTGPEADVLRAGLANLYYFTVDGPHQFEGTADESALPIARSYGLA